TVRGMKPSNPRLAVGLEPAPAPAVEEKKRELGTRVTIVVSHGMGQQVQYQTLEDLANALRQAEVEAGRPEPPIVMRRMRFGEGEATRAEMTLGGDDGVEVHFYEAYWAPYTEGKVGLGDTFRFVLSAAILGFWNSVLLGPFRRYAFNDWQVHGRRLRTSIAFLLAALVVFSLGVQ